MKVSLNTIKNYIDFELPPVDELVARINSQLGGVEEVIDLGAKYRDAKIVRVVECEKHANADKLSVCKIDVGGGELVQVVCGAPNVHAGMLAIWLPPSSTVPSTFDDDEPFVLGVRELRGVMSNGMLASASELAISEDHSGIIEITDKDIPVGNTVSPGDSFAEVFGLNDTVIDIENKMFTHRPDLFGQLGVAREISAILQGASDKSLAEDDTRFVNPDWYWRMPEFADGDSSLSLEVFNETPEAAPRFMAVAIDNVTVDQSPLWLRCELVRWGAKPINNIVDLTNYIMLLTAQPTHAYDYDKLRGQKLGVRMASSGEKVTLLNGKSYELVADDIVIADGEGVVGLAGVMGGADSEVSADTKRIVLEIATFDMYAVRKTSMRYGLFTDALTRFNKGQSPLQNDRITKQLLELIPGEQASQVFDLPDRGGQLDEASVHGEVLVTVDFINQRLGLELSENQIGSLLRRVNMTFYRPESQSDKQSVTAPFWRTDIHLPEDIVEEVGRLYGYDKLPRKLPQRSASPTPVNPDRELAEIVRSSLSQAGANEVMTYSFVHEKLLKSVGQDVTDAYRLSNALSPDLQYYRLSLTPSLLDKVHPNIKAGYNELALFEIGKSHSKKSGLGKDGMPVEPGRIALVYASKQAKDGAAYFRAKRLLESLAKRLNFDLEYRSLPAGSNLTAAAPFVAPRSARVIERNSGQAIGIIGEYTVAARKNFKLPEYSAGFELFTEGLLLASEKSTLKYKPLSRYPSIERDVCFEVSDNTPYQSVVDSINDQLSRSDIAFEIDPVDIYKSEEFKKRITVRIRLMPHRSTLTSEVANSLIDDVSSRVASQIGATII